MTNPAFKPGFRFSVSDACVLIMGILGALFVWPRTWWLGLVIAFVVSHFFLFCNVFRISRRLELIWATIFIVLVSFTIGSAYLTWTITIGLSLLASIAVVAVALKQPSYHGVGWRRVNPNLPQWWERFVGNTSK